LQNGICEAFNGRMRDELLNETVFYDLDHARATLALTCLRISGPREAGKFQFGRLGRAEDFP